MGKKRTLVEWEEELIGKKFARLTVLSIQPHIRESTGRKDGYEAVCQCSCGNQKIVIISNLLNSNTTSCGCASIENSMKNMEKLKQWKEYHPEEVKEINRKSVKNMLLWQKDHSEEAKVQKIESIKKARKWLKEHPDRAKEIDQLRLEKAHQWRKDHPEEALEISRRSIKEAHKWQKDHPEEYKEIQDRAIKKAHEWQRNNPDKVREYSLRGSKAATEWRENHKEEYKDINYRCRKSLCISQFSKEEKELYDYILSLHKTVERQFLLDNHYYDFKINNFLIEYNGSVYHYSMFENLDNPDSKNPPSEYKVKDYHKRLRDIALNNGFHLIQVWDYNWFHRSSFIRQLIKDQLNGTANYKDYIEEGLLNNDYGFFIDGEQIDPEGIWVSTGYRKIVNEDYTKGKVLVYNSGYTKTGY